MLIVFLIAMSAFWSSDASAQSTRGEIKAYCQRVRNSEASGEDRLYPAQFPTEWRCVSGAVFICEIGASGRGCLKAEHSTAPTPGVRQWCRENPNADFVPGAYLSSAAISWRCAGTKPAIVETEGVDEQGYVRRFWRKVD